MTPTGPAQRLLAGLAVLGLVGCFGVTGCSSDPRPVVIGDDVFIGSRVTILKGVHIGRGCVISAGTVVTPNFQAPDMSIVAGNPCRIVGRVKDAAAGTADHTKSEHHEPA